MDECFVLCRFLDVIPYSLRECIEQNFRVIENILLFVTATKAATTWNDFIEQRMKEGFTPMPGHVAHSSRRNRRKRLILPPPPYEDSSNNCTSLDREDRRLRCARRRNSPVAVGDQVARRATRGALRSKVARVRGDMSGAQRKAYRTSDALKCRSKSSRRRRSRKTQE